jgi:hypothetical protein
MSESIATKRRKRHKKERRGRRRGELTAKERREHKK